MQLLKVCSRRILFLYHLLSEERATFLFGLLLRLLGLSDDPSYRLMLEVCRFDVILRLSAENLSDLLIGCLELWSQILAKSTFLRTG